VATRETGRSGSIPCSADRTDVVNPAGSAAVFATTDITGHAAWL
jgi:hypothetical protein